MIENYLFLSLYDLIKPLSTLMVANRRTQLPGRSFYCDAKPAPIASLPKYIIGQRVPMIDLRKGYDKCQEASYSI